MTHLILRLDIAGQPLGWMPWQTAALLLVNDKVVWIAGNEHLWINGGRNRLTGQRSRIAINSILACRGVNGVNRYTMIPPLNNRELFRRDGHLCMYCLASLPDSKLTRDHVMPLSRGGANVWTNVVSACRVCNERKADRTPDEANMTLHGVPYTPNYAEWLTLRNRCILADQMAFLSNRF
ncbi:MAG: HNH endonuclease [Gammaproteobacteria bacterium]|nr:HNH endonuclease [Gammaproteobacteria bacterium]MDH5727646.1 HNH endonuclease [Gammaproteobacteria bacterium]